MFKKKLLSIHLNEFNYNFLNNGSKKFKCKNIQKILKFKKIKTYSVDKTQDKDLDPWVQSVTINTGKSSNFHKIFKTGQPVPKNLTQIWDILSEQKINCAIWGTMNTYFKNNKNIKIFFPDPWNKQVKVKPVSLMNAYRLPRSYAENYTDFKISKNLFNIYSFIFLCIKHISFLDLIKIFTIFVQTFLFKGFKNYNLFFLFDLISIYLFESLTKNEKINFSHIFLNSLAHFQHNNWDEIHNYKIYFKYTDAIIEKILDLSKNYHQVLIYNGFTQKRIKTEYLLRPRNPKKFLQNIGISFKKINTNMTNGGILEFNNIREKNKNKEKLIKFSIFGFRFFEVKEISLNKIFYRIQVKSFRKIEQHFSSNLIQKSLGYDSKLKIKILKKFNQNKTIFNELKYLKTTGKHFYEGILLSKKIISEKKVMENKRIFNLVKNYF